MDCITCGKSMPDDADFCPHCGRAVIRQVEGEQPPPGNTAAKPTALGSTASGKGMAETESAADKTLAGPPAESANLTAPLPPPQPTAPLPPPQAVVPQPRFKVPEPSPARQPEPAVTPRPAPPRMTAPSRSVPPPRSPAPQPPAARSRDALLSAPVNTKDRLLGAAAYVTFLPALAFLFFKQFKRRNFIRFHARQSIFFWILVAAVIGFGLLASTLGFLLVWMVTGILAVLALFLTWLVLSIKALQGEWFHLPGVGALAEHFGG